MKTALIAGSTGLIGGQLLDILLSSDRYSKVIAITRKDLPEHAKLVQVKTDLNKIESLDLTFRIDDIFCCLGTTMGKAHSKEKFHEVDFKYPLVLAKRGQAFGAQQYLLVSALGANKKSSIYYNRVKGEVEKAISSVGFATIHIFRPSLLLGPRTEKRSAEDAARFFYKVFGFIIPAKYQAVDSLKVAKAMLHFAAMAQKGIFIHESKELQDF